MARYKFDKDENGMRVRMRQAIPIFVSTAKGDYELQFTSGDDAVIVTLTPDALETLGLQCLAHIPSIASSFSGTCAEEAYRAPVRVLKSLQNSQIQSVLRETNSDTLVDFLWYMKDAEVIKAILRNMSRLAATMMLDDLNTKWRGIDPDAVPEHQRHVGREAASQMREIVRSVTGDDRRKPPSFSRSQYGVSY